MTAPAANDDHRPGVTLLMPNRDNAPLLDIVLDKLARNTQYTNVELIIVDDGSTDGSREILRRWRDSQRFTDFRVIEHEHGPGGAVAALNAGLKEATGELVVQLDADASIETPGWLELMVRLFETDPRIGALTSKIVLDSGEVQACGIHVVRPEGYTNRGAELTESARGRFAEVDGGMGVCMMYRREAALEVGGYDPGFAPVWLDDLDLTISLRRNGLKIFYVPQVLAIHHLGVRVRPEHQPPPPSRARTAAIGVRRGIGIALPGPAKRRIVRALRWDQGPRRYRRLRAQHYRHWRKKWGWELRNPDMDAIHERWGRTEICWKTNPEMRGAGERIIAALEAVARGGR